MKQRKMSKKINKNNNTNDLNKKYKLIKKFEKIGGKCIWTEIADLIAESNNTLDLSQVSLFLSQTNL